MTALSWLLTSPERSLKVVVIGEDVAGLVYRLRVVLAGVSPLIWRQLEVSDRITLVGLHRLIQTSFGWSDEHLYRFTIHGKEYGSADLWLQDPATVRLGDLGLRKTERFIYEYNFFSTLESWRYDLRVQAIEPPRARRTYPWCSSGARSAPPEECGGPDAFLALRQEHNLWITTVRMAELTRLLLEAPPTATVRGVLGEAWEELPGLLYWSKIDRFDRAGLNRALTQQTKEHPC